MRSLKLIIIVAALAAAGAAFAGEEIVVNGGFETGELSPWYNDNVPPYDPFEVKPEYACHGNYGAGIRKFANEVQGCIVQYFQRTIYPSEVEGGGVNIGFWHNAYWTSGVVGIYLGGNSAGGGYLEHNGWKYYPYIKENIWQPFDCIWIWFVAIEYGNPYWIGMYVDDVSLVLKATAAEPTSLGKVKAMFK